MEPIALNVYYKLPQGKLSQYLVQSELYDMNKAVDFCRCQVSNTLPNAYNLAILAVVPGGKA